MIKYLKVSKKSQKKVIKTAEMENLMLFNQLVVIILKFIVWLRYDIKVSGLNEILKRGNKKIFFLPSHPALIDPVIIFTTLYLRFTPRGVAESNAVNMPFIGWMCKRVNIHTMPDMIHDGPSARTEIEKTIMMCADDLQNDHNLVLWPAGTLLSSNRERLGANSAVETILSANNNDVRVVLCRTRGLWGSSFGQANGKAEVGTNVLIGILEIFANFIFFTPRRKVTLEFYEPEDFPRHADKIVINRYIEQYLNAEPLPQNTYVPHTIWKNKGIKILPEPAVSEFKGTIEEVSPQIISDVTQYMKKMCNRNDITPSMQLADDLGLDSLARAELLVWLSSEYGYSQDNPDALHTVAEIILAAAGYAVAAPRKLHFDSPPDKWFVGAEGVAEIGNFNKITDAFLFKASQYPQRAIIADPNSGVKSYRDVITSIMVLLPHVKKINGDFVGVLMPASVAATTLFLTIQFAYKVPVMINWTSGKRNILHGLDVTGVEHILTSKKVILKLKEQSIDFSGIEEKFIFIEDIAKSLSHIGKISALIQSYMGWGKLKKANVQDVAVVLFTSGSENYPKAVPLTHKNIITDMASALRQVKFTHNDIMLCMLPPFHSFGLSVNIVAVLCGGFRGIYYNSPTEGAVICKLTELYKATVLVGTPTFLYGIARSAIEGQLDTITLAVTGAEECSERIYEMLQNKCPNAIVTEGYGITECSPVVAMNDPKNPVKRSMGQIIDCVEYIIINPETDEKVNIGEQGMLCVNGPNMFSGYLGDSPDPFVEIFGNRWYRTGDLVIEDTNGVLTFKGRLKRFVKIGGEMISLTAIESVLINNYMKDSDEGPILAIIADESHDRPELILYSTKQIERDDVNSVLRSSGLSPLHFVRNVEIIEALPVLGSGKTNYRQLTDSVS
jgi:acyl-[acyl-carrier-protein]-phospholipid O-acyltransferase/long-chain-fatty-acid--[acyl-carrier-protein] ligase